MRLGRHVDEPDALAPHPITPDREGQQACYGQPTDEFFPNVPIAGRRSALAELQIAAAKELCRRCPFIHDCLAYALDRPSTWGIWGATTEDERADLRRNRRRSA